jgi:hypothetical protein
MGHIESWLVAHWWWPNRTYIPTGSLRVRLGLLGEIKTKVLAPSTRTCSWSISPSTRQRRNDFAVAMGISPDVLVFYYYYFLKWWEYHQQTWKCALMMCGIPPIRDDAEMAETTQSRCFCVVILSRRNLCGFEISGEHMSDDACIVGLWPNYLYWFSSSNIHKPDLTQLWSNLPLASIWSCGGQSLYIPCENGTNMLYVLGEKKTQFGM